MDTSPALRTYIVNQLGEISYIRDTLSLNNPPRAKAGSYNYSLRVGGMLYSYS